MKRFLIIVSIFIVSGIKAFSQEDNNADKANRLQERMQEYIQKRLNLTRNEAERFSPVFLRYIVELRRTNRQFSSDDLVRKSKIVELQVRFRGEFRQVMDEQRANKVYDYQKEFERKVMIELRERRAENKINRRNRAMIP